MLRCFLRPVGVIVMCCILLAGVGCSAPKPPPALVCGALVVVTLVSTVVDLPFGETPTAISTGITISECVTALNGTIGSTTDPQNPSTTLVIHDGKQTGVTQKNGTTLRIDNCASARTLSRESVTVQNSLQVVLDVGGRQFTAPPTGGDSDARAAIANSLIENERIPIGTTLMAPVSLTVTVLPHSQVTINVPPITVIEMVGTASMQQGSTSSGEPILWSYPSSIKVSGTPTSGLPISCK